MKKSTLVVSLIGASLLFNACSDSAVNETSTTTLSGKTTLARALVCVDSNKNLMCDADEYTTQSDESGLYTLHVDGQLEEGTFIIAKEGYNKVLLENNRNKLTHICAYSKDEVTQNINTMSSIIASKMATGMSYADAKADLSSKYNISENMIVSDPIESASTNERLLQIVHTAQKRMSSSSVQSKERLFFNFFKKSSSSSSVSSVAETTSSSSVATSSSSSSIDNTQNTDPVVVTEEQVDATVEDGSYLDFDVDSYIDELNAYFDSVSIYFNDLYDEYFGESNETTALNEDETENQIPVTRGGLNGVWFLQNDDTVDKLCAVIDSLDNITVYTTDSTDKLAIEYDGNKKIDLVSGWVTVESFDITSFTASSFKVKYSDGTASIAKISSLNECKAKL